LVRTKNVRIIPTLLQDTLRPVEQSFVDPVGTQIREDGTRQYGLQITAADAAASTADNDYDTVNRKKAIVAF
jgi:hypothetical protein